MANFETNDNTYYCFTYMDGYLCVVPQPMNGNIGYPDACTFEHFNTYEEARDRIIELKLDYSRTEWTP